MNLPSELLAHIFSFLSLSHTDVARISQVSHAMWHAAQDDVLWAACARRSKLSFWWDLSEISTRKENDRKRKNTSTPSSSSSKKFMRDWMQKTRTWAGSEAGKDVNALILGDPAYSEDFLGWLGAGSNGNKRASAITFSIGETILHLKSQVGSLVLNKFGMYEQDELSADEVDVILLHYSDTSTLYCAYMISQNAKKTYPNSAFVIAGDPTCSPNLLEELIKAIDAKAFIPINYRNPLNATTCDSLYSLLLAHGARAGIRNTSLRAPTTNSIQDDKIAKKPKLSEEAAVHSEIKCDGCGVFPIIGTRHACTTCKRVDLCAKCFAQKAQVRKGRCARHAFRQIRRFAEEERVKKEDLLGGEKKHVKTKK